MFNSKTRLYFFPIILQFINKCHVITKMHTITMNLQ